MLVWCLGASELGGLMADTESICLKGKIPSGKKIEFLSILFNEKSSMSLVEWALNGKKQGEYLRHNGTCFIEGDLIIMMETGLIRPAQAQFIRDSSEKIMNYVMKCQMEEEYRKGRVLQLAANRSVHEAAIKEINRELNELLKPEISNITY